jgi:hypothetical protein
MAKRSISVSTFTPTATADTADLVDNTYFASLQGGTATQFLETSEIQLAGQSGSSTPTFMVLGRSSTIAGTLIAGTELREGPLHHATADLGTPPVFGRSATTQAQRSATDGHLLNLTVNAFGGIVRWLAAPGEELSTFGSSGVLAEFNLSAFTGGTPGALGGHWIYEPL